jgi:hypothetical protein
MVAIDVTLCASAYYAFHLYAKCGRMVKTDKGRGAMPMDASTIAQMEKELEEARDQLLREDGRRYQILMREISEAEKERIVGSLTDRHERILFGLEPAGSRRGGDRPGKRGGNLVCTVCGKTGLTELGLKLHTARKHKEG